MEHFLLSSCFYILHQVKYEKGGTINVSNAFHITVVSAIVGSVSDIVCGSIVCLRLQKTDQRNKLREIIMPGFFCVTDLTLFRYSFQFFPKYPILLAKQ
jgi:membrane protein CcdC involved in cytochrome C biogenesis